MGWAFVKRRMMPSSAPTGRASSRAFDHHPAAAASLGQVHRARPRDGAALACKLQYPDMQSAVEADLQQLDWLFALHRRMRSGDRHHARSRKEIGGAPARGTRLPARGASMPRSTAKCWRRRDDVRVPRRLAGAFDRAAADAWTGSTARAAGAHERRRRRARNRIAAAMFTAWWFPFSRFGVIHGDPHLGNYTVFRARRRRRAGINLLDYGCIRIFPPKFVGGVVDLYHGLLRRRSTTRRACLRDLGLPRASTRDLIDTLNIWARFIYGAAARRSRAHHRRRRRAGAIWPARGLPGPSGAEAKRARSRVPREFVFMDRAAIGLGGAFLHLGARLNFHRLFNEAIGGFRSRGAARRAKARRLRGRARRFTPAATNELRSVEAQIFVYVRRKIGDSEPS